MILLNKTFEETTPESSEIGDFSDTGFEFEEEKHDFHDLIHELESEDYIEYNTYPIELNENTYISSEPYCNNYVKGSEISYSLHYSRKNKARSLKYWIKALNYIRRNK